jgi:hypothetical protein
MSLNVRGNADGAGARKMEEDEIESLRRDLSIYRHTKTWIIRSISELDAKLESTMESRRSQELEFRRLTFAILDIDVKIKRKLRSNPDSIHVHTHELDGLRSERDAKHLSLNRIVAVDRALSKDYEKLMNKKKENDDLLMEESTLQRKYDLLLQQYKAKYG